ncbi:MAG: F0F1 ATP synthase subunit beta, partial [Patescibacteria group bacterium]
MKGTIVKIVGPVVDVAFPEGEKLPPMLSALTVKGEKTEVVFEVVNHLEPGKVRAISLRSTDGLSRGMPVEASGKQIEVPVGKEVLGNIFDVLGRSLNKPSAKFS